MLCACSGEQFRLEEPPKSPESLATRDFSASGLSSRTGDWDSRLEAIQVDQAESTLKEALSLNYEEARALLGRLEYQRGNFDAALQVFRGIDVKGLKPTMTKAIVERNVSQKSRSKGTVGSPSVMSMHSVSLLLEAILLKAKSLQELGCHREAANECKTILDIVESALPNGMAKGIREVCKLQEMFHKALEFLPHVWIQAGDLNEAIAAYRRVLVKPWNLGPEKLAGVQKEFATLLLYGCAEATSEDNTEEAILLLLLLMKRAASGEIKWDLEVMDHLTYALSIAGKYELLANCVEQVLPGVYTRGEGWYLLSLCYSAADKDAAAINLLKKASGYCESRQKAHVPSLLLGAKLCSREPNYANDGIIFSHMVLDFVDKQNEHVQGQAHKFLGVCYRNAARISSSDSKRVIFQKESLTSLTSAAHMAKDDPEVVFNLSLENAVQRNLEAAFDGVIQYSGMVSGNAAGSWKLLALILSAEKRLKDAETIVDFALDEIDGIDKLEFLKLKAALQISQEQPRKAIQTYSTLLALVRAQRDFHAGKFNQPDAFSANVLTKRKLEMEAWQNLASIYAKLGSWSDAETCLDKAKLIDLNSPSGWHATGVLYEAKSLHTEALVSFFLSLSIDPDHVPSIVSTAEVLMKLGSLRIARSFLMNALRLKPTCHKAWMKLGHISKMEGFTQEAAEFFQAAYELELSAPVQSFI